MAEPVEAHVVREQLHYRIGSFLVLGYGACPAQVESRSAAQAIGRDFLRLDLAGYLRASRLSASWRSRRARSRSRSRCSLRRWSSSVVLAISLSNCFS